MSSAPVLSEADRRALMETPLTRFYVRLGIGLGVGLLVASLLVWTGTFGRMLTFGDWGMLSEPDLLGFLVAVFWMMTAALLVVLFTLKRTLSRVEVDVQARDIELDQRVRRMEADFKVQLADAQTDLRQEHQELMVLADVSNRSDREVLARARAEIAERVQAARGELEAEIRRMHDAVAARSRVEDAERLQGVVADLGHQGDHGLAKRVADGEAHQMRLVRILRAETGALRDLRDTLATRMAEFERAQADGVARAIAERRNVELLAVDQKDAVAALRQRMQMEHDEMARAIDRRMQDLVRSGVNERIRQAIEVAFRPGRFYKVLAASLGIGVALVAILALVGAEGPGLFTAKVAIFALGLASAILSGIVLVLIYSFTDTVRTLRGFAGTDRAGADRVGG